ncbi:Anti-sigma F factor antagonist [Sporomusa carbonis]|uniref:anti-sigma F factor antagonist n=1 Tax=Sporomusa carbonis TaxID=3076075 RepID=UPI003A78E45B
MKIVTVMRHGVLVAKLEGELDVHGANEFRAAIDKELDATGAKHILLNLQGVTFIDSSGLGVILGRYKRIAQRGGKMLAVHLNPQVQRIFELAGLLKILNIYDSENQALELL